MTRLRALVTAPLRGEDSTSCGSWPTWSTTRGSTRHRCGSTPPSSSPNARRRRTRMCLSWKAIRCGGPVFELPLRAVASTRGDPNNVDIAGATGRVSRCCTHPGRNADAVAEMTIALLFAATRHVLTADADVREGQVFRDGTHPLPAVPGVGGGGTNGRPGRSRRGRSRAAVATDGARRHGHRLRPVQRRGPPQPRRPARRCRHRLAACAGHRRHRRDDRRRAVRGDARRRRLPQHRARPTARHRCAGRRADAAARSPQLAWTTSSANGSPPIIRWQHAQRGADAAHRRGHVEH